MVADISGADNGSFYAILGAHILGAFCATFILPKTNGVVQIELRYDDVYQDICRSVLEMQGNDVSADAVQTDVVSQEVGA